MAIGAGYPQESWAEFIFWTEAKFHGRPILCPDAQVEPPVQAAAATSPTDQVTPASTRIEALCGAGTAAALDDPVPSKEHCRCSKSAFGCLCVTTGRECCWPSPGCGCDPAQKDLGAKPKKRCIQPSSEHPATRTRPRIPLRILILMVHGVHFPPGRHAFARRTISPTGRHYGHGSLQFNEIDENDYNKMPFD